ncbi:MAG: hypothetical protein NTY88_11625 [Bacteroidetes bacterium]|nr:hypothetical protein [Bacteroidota bacterium]
MKTKNLILALVILSCFTGCKKDFDLTAPYKEIPVVYGLLNVDSTTHYIRVQKAFLIDGDATVAAGITDSIYYSDSITIKLIGYLNGSRKDSFYLHKIDGNTIGLPKDSGLFANTPNILYTFNGVLKATENYRLEVSRDGKMIARTTDGSNVSLVNNFIVNTPYPSIKFNLSNAHPTTFSWQPATNAAIYDLTVRFFYREINTSGITEHSIDIPFFNSKIPDDLTSSSNVKADFTADILLSKLVANLPQSTDITREFKQMNFMFAAGGIELSKFVESQHAQTGITSGEALPVYTNIVDGTGLLSSRYFKQVDSVLFSPAGIDSLACSDISRGLRFKNHFGMVCN